MPEVAVAIEDSALRHRVVAALEIGGVDVVASDVDDPCDAAVISGSPAASSALGGLIERVGRGRLVFLCTEMPRRGLRDVVEVGGGGLVLVDRLEDSLAFTVRAVIAGQLCVPIDEFTSARPLLSPREKQILGMVTLGFSNAEIASQLVVTEATVKSHLNSGFRKLGVKSRSEAAHLILDPVQGLGTGILSITDGD